MSVITATDADHLDIYGTYEAYLESFAHYTELIQPGGALIIHEDLKLKPRVQNGVRTFTYSRDKGDFHADNIRIGNGEIFFDFVAPNTRINDVGNGVVDVVVVVVVVVTAKTKTLNVLSVNPPSPFARIVIV
jgi:UDP-N-acetylmuramate--alanine ligase